MKPNDLKSFLVVASLFLITIAAKSQDQLHPIFTAIPVNPAYTGDNEYTNLHVYSRIQAHVNTIGSFEYLNQSFSMVLDGIVKGNPDFGWGAQITTRIGDEHNETKHLGHLMGSWRIPITATARLNVGISAGIAYKQELNNAALNHPSKVSDLRFGLYYKEPSWYAAASIVNLTGNPVYSTSSYFSSGTTFRLTDKITLSPGLDLQANFDAVNEGSAPSFKFTRDNTEFSVSNSVGFYEKYSFTIGYGQGFNKTGQSIALAAGIEMTKILKLSATYGLELGEQYGLEQSVFGVALTAYVGAAK